MDSRNTSLSRLAESALVVLVGTVFGNSIALLAELFIVNSLSPDVYGTLALAYAVVFSIGNIALLGVHEGVTRQFSATTDSDRRIQIVIAGFILLLFSGIGTSLGLYALRYQLAQLLETQALPRFLVLFLPYLLVFPLARVAFATLRGQKRTVKSVFARHIGGRGLAVCALVVFVILDRSLHGAFAYWIGFPTFTLAIALYFLWRTADRREVLNTLPDRSTFSTLWSFSWPLAIGSVIFLLLGRLDILMIGYFMEPSDVAYYRAVQPLKTTAMFALGSFTFLFLPLATEYHEAGDETSLDRIFTVSTKWVLLITLPPVLIFGLFSESVVEALFGQQYLPAAPVLTILVLGLLFRAVSGLDGDMVKAIDRPRLELYSGVVGLISNLVLNIVLIPRFGIRGAAIATVVGYLFYNGTELLWIRALTGATPFSINVAKHVVTMIAIAVGVAYVSPTTVGLPGLIGLGILLVAIEPIVLVGTKSIDQADLEFVERLENRVGLDLDIVKRVIYMGL